MSKRYGEYEQVNGAVCNDLIDRIEELEALLESEDGAHTMHINKLEAQIERLQSIRPYSAHRPSCPAFRPFTNDPISGPSKCKCGLTEAIKALERE